LYHSYVTEYAQVTKMLGNGRLEAMCFDGVKRLCHIRGKLRKKVGSVTHTSVLIVYDLYITFWVWLSRWLYSSFSVIIIQYHCQ